ncbi:LysR family transcriptional regulator [Sphingomonas xinjiangensis]|uniref:DNA-binding transcriptional LysR family regulator n=1 Tax=Sphingomonas xinjiangensis TaxID=643568 RepID=A0A840YS39_9SPHN|nr:LysR family transcriptional regulator [Sphingomonas xinjiangensis]MBB5712499.1 DNA-binding transcriptional LysR family regulator [Sphingomonas xinjiangensis]
MWFDERLISGVGVFASAVESGSFVAASGVVGLTTSGVSRAVGRLEERLGVKLFHRTARGIVPTSEGLRFYEQTVPLLHRLAESADEIRGAEDDPVGLLTVRADASASLFLAHVTPGFMAVYPQIDLRIDEEGSAASSTDWDVRLYIGDEPSPHAIALLDSETVVCASPAYLARAGAPETPTDLTSSHTCLDQNTAGSRAMTWRFSQTGLQAIVQTPNRISFSSISTLMHAVLAGTGIGCLPRLLIDQALRSGHLVQVLPDWSLGTKSLFACAPVGQSRSARATALIAFLRDEERRLDQRLGGCEPVRQRPALAA